MTPGARGGPEPVQTPAEFPLGDGPSHSCHRGSQGPGGQGSAALQYLGEGAWYRVPLRCAKLRQSCRFWGSWTGVGESPGGIPEKPLGKAPPPQRWPIWRWEHRTLLPTDQRALWGLR